MHSQQMEECHCSKHSLQRHENLKKANNLQVCGQPSDIEACAVDEPTASVLLAKYRASAGRLGFIGHAEISNNQPFGRFPARMQ